MSHGVPGTVTGGGGGAGCGSGVFVVSVGGAGSGVGVGADGSVVGAAEDEVDEAEVAGEGVDAAGPEASDVPQAVGSKAIATSAALRIAHPPRDRAVY